MNDEPGDLGDGAPQDTDETGAAICPVCSGSGETYGARCEQCGGTGEVIEGIGGA